MQQTHPSAPEDIAASKIRISMFMYTILLVAWNLSYNYKDVFKYHVYYYHDREKYSRQLTYYHDCE